MDLLGAASNGAAFLSLNQIPGPGTYAPELSMKSYKDKAGYTMQRRYNERPFTANPGPGSYTRKTFIEQLAARSKRKDDGGKRDEMKSRNQMTKINPGPGEYKRRTFLEDLASRSKRKMDEQPSQNVVKDATNNTNALKTETLPVMKHANPGPGSYTKPTFLH